MAIVDHTPKIDAATAGAEQRARDLRSALSQLDPVDLPEPPELPDTLGDASGPPDEPDASGGPDARDLPGEPDGKHPGSPVHIYTRKAPAQSVAEMRALLDSELDTEG